MRFGARHASTANCSSSGLRSRSRASPSTWSNDGGRPARDGEPSCVTTRRTLPPWTCSLFQLLVSICSMPSSSSGSTAETWSGSTSQQIRRQNGFAERLIGSIRRECVDHIIVLGEVHLRQILQSYARYYNDIRTHRSLDKDAPVSRPVQSTGSIKSHPILDGLHHHYARV